MERKVLFSASTYSHIINFHLPYLKEFRRLGWTVHAACGGEPRKIPEAQRLIHIPFEKSMTSPHNFSAAALLRRVIRQENYTLISCHTSLASFFVRLAVLGMRHRPLVACTSHGYLFDDCSPKLKQLLLSVMAAEYRSPVCGKAMTIFRYPSRAKLLIMPLMKT